MRVGCVVGERNEWLTNDCIGLGVDYRDIARPCMRCLDSNLDRHLLTGRERLYVGGVVLELVAFAEEDVALGWVVILLAGGYLQLALNVAAVVGFLLVKELLSTDLTHGIAGLSWRRICDYAMAIYQRNDCQGNCG